MIKTNIANANKQNNIDRKKQCDASKIITLVAFVLIVCQIRIGIHSHSAPPVMAIEEENE